MSKTNHKTEWLRNVNRVVDITKNGKTIHERCFIKNVDIKNFTLFILTSEGEDITLTMGKDMSIKKYPEETAFKVNGKVLV